MTIPAYRDVDLALLLELVRRGGSSRPSEVYAGVASHFPNLTEEDLALTRSDGRTKVFTNTVHWARDHLRTRNLLDTTVPPGQWKLLGHARQTLVDDLVARSSQPQSRVEAFVAGTQPLPALLGRLWSRPVRAAPGRRKKGEPAAPSPRQRESERESVKKPMSHDAIKRELMHRLQALDGYAFEQFVARVLDSLGFTDTRVTSPSGDSGVDVMTYINNPLIRAKVAVQVKRQSANVGPKEISYLRDRWGRRSDRLLFITTSDYTIGAREVAADGDMPVELITGEQLIQTMIDNGIGITTHPVISYEVDEEYFEGI